MPDAKCSIDDCDRIHYGRGYCHKHWRRWYNYGDAHIMSKPNRPTPEDRFWRHVDKTASCWIWTAGTNSSGYGCFGVNRKLYGSHRYSFYLHHGRMPEQILLHSCDNPRCVNPAHLREGTMTDNMQDRDSRGRQAKGEAIHRSTLTEDKVRKIRSLLEQGVLQSKIAGQFGVMPHTISRIKNRHLWKHI